MSLQFRIADQVLKVDDASEATVAVVRKYDAFLNLLCADRYAFQRDAVREALRFLVSDKYPDLERLARENWDRREAIRQRHESVDAYLARMPLRDRKSASLDLATGTGKSFVMYALAAIALAEGLAERVLVLCPSLTIEDGLLEKFTTLAGNSELSEIMKELGAAAAIPGIKRGNETIEPGDICIENIHAVYARNYPEKNVKLAFTTLKNQMGESYQLCAKGIYHSGYPVPMPVSSCREYCIDVRKNPDGTVGCNYLKWLNENLTTNEQAMNFFDKIPVEHEKMNLEDGERSRFPMSDQDSQETKVRRLDKLENEPFEKQLDKFHGKEKKAEKSEETPDEAIEALLKDAREAFDDDDLDTLEQLLREAMGE